MKLPAEATETCYNRPELQQRASCSITPPLCSMRTAREERASQDHALPALDSNTIGGLTRGKQSRCITYLGSRKKKKNRTKQGEKSRDLISTKLGCRHADGGRDKKEWFEGGTQPFIHTFRGIHSFIKTLCRPANIAKS